MKFRSNGTYLQVEFENSSESESEESTEQSIIIELQKENKELREQVRNLEKFQEMDDRLRLTSSDTQDCDSNSVSSSIIAVNHQSIFDYRYVKYHFSTLRR